MRPAGGHHTTHNSLADVVKARNILRKCQPFVQMPGRHCTAFEQIKASPLVKIKADKMREGMSRTIRRLSMGINVELQAEET